MQMCLQLFAYACFAQRKYGSHIMQHFNTEETSFFATQHVFLANLTGLDQSIAGCVQIDKRPHLQHRVQFQPCEPGWPTRGVLQWPHVGWHCEICGCHGLLRRRMGGTGPGQAKGQAWWHSCWAAKMLKSQRILLHTVRVGALAGLFAPPVLLKDTVPILIILSFGSCRFLRGERETVLRLSSRAWLVHASQGLDKQPKNKCIKLYQRIISCCASPFLGLPE